MIKYIQLYFATLAGCVITIGLMFLTGFLLYTSNPDPKLIYCFFVFLHLAVQSIFLYQWNKVTILHKVTSISITILVYIIIPIVVK